MEQKSRLALHRISVSLLGVLLLCFLPLFLARAATMSSPPDITSRFGGVYRRPLTNDPSLLDPARTTDVYANTVVNQLFDGLVQFDSDLNPIPAIAGFWEASLDGLTWTFHLRKNVEFHHGREVTAGDFVYSFTRILDPAIQSPVAELFKYIQGAEDFRTGKTEQIQGLKALGSHTLEIRLREPYAPFLSILAMANAKVLPREAVEKLGEQFAFQPVGSGPFQFVRWERNAEIVLQSYNYYYEGRPFLDQIVFKIGKQDVENLSDFLEGELEETIVPGEKVTEIRESSLYRPYIRRRIPTLHLLYVGFNTRKEPFINPKVRQAFNYAINKEAIIREIIKQGSIIAKGILPPGMPGYNPDLVEYYYNPDLAKQLLSEAGYPGGKGIPIIDLWSSSRDESTAKVLEAYKKDLATLGVTVTIHQAPDWPSFTKLLEEGKLSMFRLAWYADIPDPDNFFFPLLYSQSKTNRTFYQNPQVDQLLEQARRETEYLKRMEIYRRVERIAVSDAPWITQNHRVFEYLYQPYVQGVELNSLGPHYIPMKKIWLQRAKEQQEKRNP